MIPHIVRRQLDAARQQVPKLAELAYRLGQPAAQTVDVGAALGCWDQIDVALGDRLPTLGQPHQGPVRDLVIATAATDERFLGQRRRPGQRVHQVVAQPVLVAPLVVFRLAFAKETDQQAGAQHRLGTQQMAQLTYAEFRRIEEYRVRPELDPGTGIGPPDPAHFLEFRHLVAIGEGDIVFGTAALDPDLKMLRQGIHHRHPNAVQTTGEAVAVVGELATGMQLGQDHLDTGDTLFGVDVNWHPATVVADLD